MSSRSTRPGVIERPRYLRDPRDGRGDYTRDPGRRYPGWPEPVTDEWLERFSSDARSRTAKLNLTIQRAATHGIRVVLRHEGPANSTTVKLRVAEALNCTARTIERAAADMPDLRRRRGYRSATTWSIFTSDSPDLSSRGENSSTSQYPLSGALDPEAIRRRVVSEMIGSYQSTTTDRDVAAELITDTWVELMGGQSVYEQRPTKENL